MSKIESVPKELLLEILIFCLMTISPGANRAKFLNECQHVCRNFSKVSQVLLYKELTFNKVEQAKKFIAALSKEDPKCLIKLGGLVRCINLINDSFGEEEWHQLGQKGIFVILFKMVPHLKEIHVENPTEAFWKALKDAQKDFQNIKSISEGVKLKFAKSYVETTLVYKKTLERFSILYEEESPSIDSLPIYLKEEGFTELCELVGKFLNLTYVEFPFFSNNRSFISFLSMLSTLTRLNSMKISIKSLPERRESSIVQDTTSLPSDISFLNVNYLGIIINSDFENVLKCVMKNFTNLKTFRMSENGRANIHLSEDLVSYLVFQFGTKLTEMQFVQSISNTFGVVQRLAKDASSRNMKIRVVFKNSIFEEEINLEGENEDDICSIMTVFQTKNGLELVFDGMKIIRDQASPIARISENFGVSADSVYFSGTRNEDDDDNDGEEVGGGFSDGAYLGTVLSKVSTLVLQNWDIFKWTNEGDTSAPSLRFLNICDNSSISPDVLYKISQRAVATLNFLRIDHVTIFDEENLRAINIKMPDTKLNELWLGHLTSMDRTREPETYYLKISTKNGNEYFFATLNKERYVFGILLKEEYARISKIVEGGDENLHYQLIHVQLKSLEKFYWKPFKKDEIFYLLK